MVALIIALPLVVLLVPSVVVVFSGGSPAVLVVIGILMLVVVAYLGTLFSLAHPAYVVERLGIGASLSRSRSLVGGAWWRTFGILLLAGLTVAVPLGVVIAIVGPGQFAGTAPGTTVGGAIVVALVSIVVSTVATPFVLGVTGLVHHDRRIRRETGSR